MNRSNHRPVTFGVAVAGVLALLAAPRVSADEWPSPDEIVLWERECGAALNGEGLPAIVEELLPLVERISGREFKQVPSVQIAKPAEVAEQLEAEWGRMLRAAAPHTDEFERVLEVKLAVATVLPTIPARFFASRDAILVNDRALCMIRTAWNKYRADDAFDAQALLKVAIARELARALQEQHAGISTRLLAATSNEALAAGWAVSESQARWVQREVAAELKADSESDLLNELFRTSSLTLDDRQHGHVRAFYFKDRALLFNDGDTFIKAHAEAGGAQRLWEILNDPPRTDRVIRQPNDWKPGAQNAQTIAAEMDRLTAELKQEGFKIRRSAIEEFEAYSLLDLPGRTALADKAKEAAAFKIRDGELLSAESATGDTRRFVLILRMKDEESARTLLQTRHWLYHRRFESMNDSGLDEAKYTTTAGPRQPLSTASIQQLRAKRGQKESGVVALCGVRSILYVELLEITIGSAPSDAPFGLNSMKDDIPNLALD